MSISRDARLEILNLLQNLSKEYVDQEGAMCNSFVLASEWMASDGTYYTLTITDSDSPPWRHEGLLNYTIAHDIYETLEEEEGDD